MIVLKEDSLKNVWYEATGLMRIEHEYCYSYTRNAMKGFHYLMKID